jgi:hypothetical protein
MILGCEILRPVKKAAVSGFQGVQNWAGTLTCKQYHLQAEERGRRTSEEKIVSTKPRRSGGRRRPERMREWGANFSII